MAIESIRDFNLAGRKVFIRCDFNVSFKKGIEPSEIQDDTRIRGALETIRYAREQKAKVILASHLGRPEGKKNDKYTLLPVAERLRDLLEMEVLFSYDCIGEGPRKLVADLQPGGVLLLENLRFHKGEEDNDLSFSQKLAESCDVFINDAFGTMHRAHASTVGLPALIDEKGIGFLVEKELKYLGQLFKNPARPLIAIVGGNKISDKTAAVRQLLNHVDTLFVVGAMAYTFLKQKGVGVGQSLLERDKLDLVAELQRIAEEKKVKIMLPVDHVIADRFAEDARYKITDSAEIPPDWMGLDIGPKTIELFRREILKAKTIFWNGPAGLSEWDNFKAGTLALAQALADSGATTIVGGGDSVTAINKLGFADKITLLSTGGGATLDFLGAKPFPGLKAVEN